MSEWKDIIKGADGRTEFDFEQYSLQVKTDTSQTPAGSYLAMSWFSEEKSQAGSIYINFGESGVKYSALYCVDQETVFQLPESVGDAAEKTWTFTRTKEAVTISCNEEKVLNLQFDTDCAEGWTDYWGLEPMFVQFDSLDKVSTAYRQIKNPEPQPDGDTG